MVCQIGAREHYAIPRALERAGELRALSTDFWVSPKLALALLPGARRLRDRWHPDLAKARVFAPNLRMLGFEAVERVARSPAWDRILRRNELFQRTAIESLKLLPTVDCQLSTPSSSPVLFSYSYAAKDLFLFARQRGWTTVLGQIDPGPEEERIVAGEQQRYPALGAWWSPAPREYWQNWREECRLADRIVVNSAWSRECLVREGVPAGKVEVIPLVFEPGEAGPDPNGAESAGAKRSAANPGPRLWSRDRPFRLLFLGQINLRKGVGRLLDAMQSLEAEPVRLILAGPSSIDPAAWSRRPNLEGIGPVPRSATGALYRQANAFILPTLSDGYALTQLEALWHGVPVIASKQCGAAVEPGRNGWILDDLEPETIARTIRRAMSEVLPDVRPPAFSLADLANCLLKSVH
jgi:glycosyltransferase involved in cell wall biosynthesis